MSLYPVGALVVWAASASLYVGYFIWAVTTDVPGEDDLVRHGKSVATRWVSTAGGVLSTLMLLSNVFSHEVAPLTGLFLEIFFLMLLIMTMFGYGFWIRRLESFEDLASRADRGVSSDG